MISLNKRNTKDTMKFPIVSLVCDAGLTMHKNGKNTYNGHTCQKFYRPFRQSKSSAYPCNRKNWSNGKKNRGCIKCKTSLTDYWPSINHICFSFKKIYALRSEC